jgi:cyclase
VLKPPPPPEGGTLDSDTAKIFYFISKTEMNMKENMFYGAGHLIFVKAKQLRNNVTPTEMILWGRLKEYFPGIKFRRQHPISFYIVDLYCHSKKLVIEIDGSVHNLEEIKIIDEVRQKELEALGLKVIRFTTREIMYELESVLQRIEKHLE